MISDGELSRAVNALSTTLRDQRPRDFDTARFQSIVDGALAGERKLVVQQISAEHGLLNDLEGNELGRVDRTEGTWSAARTTPAGASGWATPR